MQLRLEDLLDYTDWQRESWHAFFRQHGVPALGIGVGPNGDGRFRTVGELVRHVFSAEKRFIERLAGRPLTDTSSIPVDDVDGLFVFGRQSRSDLRAFVASLPATQWDVSQEMTILDRTINVSPRKIVVHVALHEIRHWGQIATLVRLNGLAAGFQDFLFSPVEPR